MKAWVLENVGDISLQDIEVPKPGENEVLINVMAAGICGSDIPRIYETGAHRMPLVPGHEFSGVVDAAGGDAGKSFIGKRVGVFPKIPCGKCAYCQKGRGDLCNQYDYVGSRRDGAFAEYVTAPFANLIELPDNVTFDEAAMLEPMSVSVNAVRTGIKTAGDAATTESAICVCGLGTIGLMITMILKGLGYDNLYVVGNKDFQREKAALLGVSKDRFCDSRIDAPDSWLKEKSHGIDIYFECVGSNESINYGLRAAVPAGAVIIVGNPRSDMYFDRNTYWEIPRKQLTVKGIWNSVFRDDWEYALKLIAGGNVRLLDLVTHRLPISELDKGFLIMWDKTEDYCKILMS